MSWSRITRSSTAFPQINTTPPQTRKRKAATSLEITPVSLKRPKIQGKIAPTTSQAALSTPPLTTMDSDDEFMSGLSSQDEGFGATQDSDDDSLGDGEFYSDLADRSNQTKKCFEL